MSRCSSWCARQPIVSIFAARAGAGALERLQAEAERRRTLTILDETTDFIGSTDLQGNFLYLNLAARHLLGIAADADVSRRDLSELHPASAMDIVTRIGIPTAVRQGMWTGETTVPPRGRR